QFVCSAPLGQLPFHLHGPVRVASDHRHFEHADGIPFFWLADTVWDGARMAEAEDWMRYAVTRADQHFNVAQWAVSPGTDRLDQLAYSGEDQLWINPAFFQRLDAKIDILSRAGLISAVVPILETAPGAGRPLPEDQVALLIRYLVARWGSEPVLWLLMVPPDP